MGFGKPTKCYRVATALLLTMLLSLVLAACGGTSATNTPVTSATTAAPAATTAVPAATTAARPTTAAAVATTAPATSATTAPAANVKRGGVLKVGINQDVVGFDPHISNATATFRVVEHIYSGLLRFNEKLEVQPDLAQEYKATDPTTYTFTLRKGVKFHNGREMKAEDVKYSLNRIKDPATGSPRAADFSAIETIETPDDYTVVLKLKNPFAPMLATLSAVTTAIVPKEVVDANNGKLDKVAVGTGPFKLTEYVPNTRIKLDKHTEYFIAGKPYLDGILFQPIPDDTARTNAVRTGTVDLIEYAAPKDLSIIKSDSKLILFGDGNTNYRFLALNTKVKPFDNPKVRQAIAWAVDRQPVVDAAYSGAGTPLNAGPFPPSYWAGLQNPIYKQDIAKAKQLLTEAGYPNGIKAKLKMSPTYSFLSNSGIVVQEQAKAAGIEFELVPQEWSIFLKEYLEGNFEAAVSGTSGFADPHNTLDGNFVTGRRGNVTGYSNPQVDKLIADASASTDQAQRVKLYQEVQTILANEAPMVFLWSQNQYEAAQSYVKGYVHFLNGSHISFRDTWIDK